MLHRPNRRPQTRPTKLANKRMSVTDQVEPRRSQLAGRLVWPACGLTVALLAAGLLLPADTPVGLTGLAPVALWAGASSVVGAVVATRRSENPIGWLLAASGLLIGVGLFAGQYAFYTLITRPGSLPGGPVMLWLSGWPFDAGFFLVLFLLLLFPTGRLPSSRWRPVLRFAVAIYIADLVGRAFGPGPVNPDELGPLPNPLGIEAAADLIPVIIPVDTTLLLVAALAAVASLLARLRRAQEVERQQLKWFCYAAGLFAAAAFVAVALPAALFQPARRRIQQTVDRRFNRRRFDMTKTVEAFSARLRDQVDLDTLSAELLAVVDQTIQPTQASLWLRPADRRSVRTGT
jgi:hypothetical protein